MKKIIIIVIILLIAGVTVWFLIPDEKKDGLLSDNEWKVSEDNSFETTIVADERFGFLIGPSSEEMKAAREIGASWVRPHPGPFVWGDMQNSKNSDIDFTETDSMVKAAATYNINILPTIWHYAEWDQINHSNSDDCLASSGEFEREFGKYRCKPNDWDAYTTWVTAIVERYDGDGIDDMPDLKKPLTHWEVMNEPDLGTPDGSPGLQFLIGQPSDYAELLKKTSAVIRQTDPSAKILIAGAAGGNEMFLNYFREVFKDTETHNAFDIANVHCISNDDVDSFNVVPYTKMLDEFSIDKPIWVTEAEAFISDDHDIIAEQLIKSSQNAFANGAETIFYTSMNLGKIPGGDKKDEIKDKEEGIDYTELEKEKKGAPEYSTEIYQNIFNSL
ncbi:MAG: glycosyl hydrolase [bacterium]|nr:glycosyl hydrolase [bacterium]